MVTLRPSRSVIAVAALLALTTTAIAIDSVLTGNVPNPVQGEIAGLAVGWVLLANARTKVVLDNERVHVFGIVRRRSWERREVQDVRVTKRGRFVKCLWLVLTDGDVVALLPTARLGTELGRRQLDHAQRQMSDWIRDAAE